MSQNDESASDGADPRAGAGSQHDGGSGRSWARRGVIALLILIAAVLIYVLLQAFLPEWWANRIGGQVEGTTVSGVMWGGFYGFVFSAIPLLMLTQARRSWVHWQGRVFLVVAAVLVATPNWLTLSVVAGNSESAATGRSVMDTEAPGFRAAGLIGVLAGVGVIVLAVATRWLLARRKRQIAELRRRLDESGGSA